MSEMDRAGLTRQEGYRLRVKGQHAPSFHTASGSHLTFAPLPATLTNQWHPIVATVNTRSKARVSYRDGDAVASDKGGGEANKTGILSIGESTVFQRAILQRRNRGGGRWNRALSGDDVSRIYAASQPGAH